MRGAEAMHHTQIESCGGSHELTRRWLPPLLRPPPRSPAPPSPSTGGKAEAWCLLLHADAFPSGGTNNESVGDTPAGVGRGVGERLPRKGVLREKHKRRNLPPHRRKGGEGGL
jgi:hypothetical protein